MKIFFFLILVFSLNLFPQQKPFAFYHSAWSGVPQLPETFTITDVGDGTLDVFADGFSNTPVAYDSCLVLIKEGSYPASRYDGTAFSYYHNAPTDISDNVDVSAVDGQTFYALLYLRSSETGKWSGAITDTAYIGIPDQLAMPTLLLSSGSGSITVDADDLDPNATHVLIQQRSFQNHTSIWRDGSRFKDSLVAVGNLPLTFTGRYYDEVWHFKIAAVNSTDTSDFTAVDSSWAVNTVGDTIWYAASATGNGFGSDSLNAKVYSVTNIQNDIYANVPGRHIKLKNTDTFASSSRILLPFTQAWSGRFNAPIVIEPWNDTGPLPVVDRTTSGEIIYIERGNHITFRRIHFAGTIGFNVPSGQRADNFRWIDCQHIGTGSGASGMIGMYLQETNVVAYDSVNRGFADSLYIYNCLFQNIYSSDDAIGSSSGGIDWVIYRNVVANTGSAQGQDGIDVGYGLRVVIAYNKVFNTWNNGIKIMAQRGPNHNALVCYNQVIGNNMSGDGNFAFDIRTCVDIRFMNNSGTGFGYGLPAETSWPDNTHNGDLNDNSTYPVIAFQGIGANIFNNLYVGGSGNGYSGWMIAGGKNIMFTYPGGDTTRATWGPGRDDWGRWYLNYSSWHHNLYNNPQGGDKARYVARYWPASGNGSITWNGSSYDLSIGSHSWNERDMEEFGTGYTDKFFSNIFLPAQVVDSSYNNDSDRGSLQPVAGSPALYAGTFNGMAVDLNWQEVPDTLVSIGAYQNPYVPCSATNHFTTAGIPFANNDFLVQQNGYKNITVTGHTALQGVDSVRLALYKNGVLFLSDTEMLSYDGCDSSNFSVSINIPADTTYYTLRLFKDASVIDTASGLLVGNAYLISGQSNAIQDVTGYSDSLANQLVESQWIQTYIGWNGITKANDVNWNWGFIGTSAAILADSLVNKRGIPVYIQNGAVGGSSITQHLGGDTYYTQLRDAVQSRRQHINGWTRVYWWQIESETVGNFEEYSEYFDSLAGLWDVNLGARINGNQFTVVQAGMHSCLNFEGRTFELQRKLSLKPNVDIIGIAGFTGFNVDQCHLQFSEYKNIGTWLYRQHYYSGYTNPVVDSIAYTANDSTVTVYFDQNVFYSDTLAVDHDDYWYINDDSLMVDTGYVSGGNSIKLVLKDNLPSVSMVGYLRNYQYHTGGYYRYPFIRNANRVSAILFDSLSVNNYGGSPLMSPPSQFIVTLLGDDSVRIQSQVDADTDTMRINFGTSIPANRYADSTILVRASSGNLDTIITSKTFSYNTNYNFKLWTGADSSGTWVWWSTATDTARINLTGSGDTVTTSPIHIVANGDDGELNFGYGIFPSGESDVIYSGWWEGGNTRSYGWFRFQLPVDIPSGSTILSATKITFYQNDGFAFSNDHAVRLWLNDTINSTAPTIQAHSPMSGVSGVAKVLTTASVRWPASGNLTWTSGSTIQTPDLSSLLQELVDTYGTLAQNTWITFYIASDLTTDPSEWYIGIEDYNAAGTNEATLIIKFVP